MSSFHETLRYLYGLQFFGIKLGLENTHRLAEFLGNPHTRYPTIHVAGTNGKGSTCAMLDAILRAAGYRTGLYTSPHIRAFSERIRVNGRPIPEADVVRLTETLRPKIDEWKCTFFEATTVMAFRYFEEQSVDVAIIETGLGGRLDATNIVTPEIGIVTTIGREHTEHLGGTLQQIAEEKAGILKSGKPFLVGEVTTEVRTVFTRIADERAARCLFVNEMAAVGNVQYDVKGSRLDLELHAAGLDKTFLRLQIGLAGEHQVRNACLAAAAAFLQDRLPVRDEHVRQGLSTVQWSGRLQFIAPDVLVDAAHNPDALAELCRSIRQIYRPGYKRLFLIVGMLADKDYRGAAEILAPAFDRFWTVTPASDRALDGRVLAELLEKRGKTAKAAGTVQEALTLARKECSPEDLIVITGSHYVLSEIPC
jgi:dihydrofolate synthase/folylpolyglutamate synthase